MTLFMVHQHQWPEHSYDASFFDFSSLGILEGGDATERGSKKYKTGELPLNTSFLFPIHQHTVYINIHIRAYLFTKFMMSDHVCHSQTYKELPVSMINFEFPSSPQSMNETPPLSDFPPIIRKREYSDFASGYKPVILEWNEPAKKRERDPFSPLSLDDTPPRPISPITHNHQYPDFVPGYKHVFVMDEHVKRRERNPSSPQSLDDTPPRSNVSPIIRKRQYSDFEPEYKDLLLDLDEPAQKRERAEHEYVPQEEYAPRYGGFHGCNLGVVAGPSGSARSSSCLGSARSAR
jgi:hypothetical protein